MNWLSQKNTLMYLRISLAVIFMSHAIVRILNGTIPQFAAFLDSKGFILSVPIVWMITIFEIAGGALFAYGKFVKWIAIGLIIQLMIGIILIHASLGWFVGEHGAGGSEYSFILIMALLVFVAKNPE